MAYDVYNYTKHLHKNPHLNISWNQSNQNLIFTYIKSSENNLRDDWLSS